MRTFAVDNARARGFTLVEALVALAIVAGAGAIAAAAIAARAPARAVDQAAQALIVDLKRLRLMAELEGAPIALTGSPAGYAAPAGEIERAFPSGVRAQWNGASETVYRIGARNEGMAVVLHRKDARAIVTIAPFTGEILRVR